MSGSDPDLVGRDGDLAVLVASVGEARLVTVVGPGGVGKTRLARALLRAMPSGRFADLSEERTLLGACAAIARALEAPLHAPLADPVESLRSHIAERGPVLVVLDNAEQLVEQLADAVARWLDTCTDARFVVTSRQRLGLAGERVLDLSTLGPTDARELFVRRASALSRDWVPTGSERAIEALCAELDGLPLAIELAAARVRVMSVEELRARIGKRFEALGRGPRGGPERHATLFEALEWSWGLCDATERAALAQCAIFEGGFDLEAAEAVLALPDETSVLDVLASLVDKSLVIAEREPVMRYRTLATVREHALFRLEALGGVEETARRHAAHYLPLALRAADRSERRAAIEERAWLGREEANLRAIHRRAIASATSKRDALDAALALQPVLITRGPATLRLAILDEALAANDEGDPIRVGWARLARGDALQRLGRIREAQTNLSDAIAAAMSRGDTRLEAAARWRLGALHASDGRHADGTAELERVLELVRAAHDRFHEGRCLSSYGAALLESAALGGLGAGAQDAADAHERAAALLREAARAHAQAGDATYAATTEGLFGILAHAQGALDDAERHLKNAIAAHVALEHRRWLPSLLAHLASVELERGDPMAARRALVRAAEEARRSGDRRVLGTIALLEALALEAEGERAEAGFEQAAHSEDPLLEAVGRAALVRIRSTGGDARGAREAVAGWSAGERRDVADLHAIARAMLTPSEGPDVAETAGQSPSFFVRHASRGLAELRRRAGADALVVGPDASFFRPPGGGDVSLARRQAPRRLLDALVRAHAADGERRLDVDALFAIGWPGERAIPKAAAGRVYTAMSTLRRLGLDPYLERDDEGYRLTPTLRVASAPA